MQKQALHIHLVAGNLNQLVTLNNASPIILTVPPSVFSAGDVINIAQIGAGQVTLAEGAGVTITSNRSNCRCSSPTSAI
jgi:hypothetical protein